MNLIPYGRQDISDADIAAVVDVLRSDYLTQGPLVPRFEREIAQFVGVKHGIAVNSATSALHIACLALGLGTDDWLWTSPITFVASSNCALYCGARVDFVDIDPKTYNMSPQALEQKLVVAEAEGKLPKIVVPVHLCGQSCDMAAINRLSKRFGFSIIEDASHAVGGRYQGQPIGDCSYSDITIFSFHPVKIITTAEGGMAMTNNDELAARMQLFRSHGITRDSEQMTQAPDGPWYYQQIELGYNYRMTELQAALGVSQTKRLQPFVERRHELARRYNEKLAELPLTLPWQHPDSFSALHLYVVRVPRNGDRNHHDVFISLREQGIGVNLHYIPVHTQPYYSRLGFKKGDFPEAEAYYAEAISLPMYATLTVEQQDAVVAAVTRSLE
jgi:UDP-4-amino-4,6-dideoxy-N-acetyl-beta-L-altrosamine transaminase